MADFFTSDTHLGHANILKYCNRPFLSEEEKELLIKGVSFKVSDESLERHDDTIINNINACVGTRDTLWHLGDFAWGNELYNINRYRDRINCRDIRLVMGNHDTHKIRDAANCFYRDNTSFMFREVDSGFTWRQLNHQDIFMCHYPMRSWHKSHHGSWSLFGHVHGNLQDIPHLLTLDVGVDTHNFKPWSWKEICDYMNARKPAWEAHRASWKDKDLGGMEPGTHD